ncbi:L,D-transpeptidase family protein [Candidatus Coxiella mudrowiae]|uniref:L,D-transpeptidase family protein n=1 Tax=Candidatus Coxiella mudrowiae TaxID=2054173 RepID=UPI001FD2F683|nr:L,D-transpeptidase family protein [Candidatus Coxiella mudrowiae]
MIMKIFRLFCLFFLFSLVFPTFTLRFLLPSNENNLFGQIQFATVQNGDTFSSIAQHYDVGYYELVETNPEVDPDHPIPGTVLIISTQYLLPHIPRNGIVINLASMRLFYFPQRKNYFYTFPVGIGKFNWSTPLGKLQIIQKIKNPVWVVPDSIFRYRQEQGDPVPKVVPSGPDNPLGYYALRLSEPTYLIHGTNDPGSVGRRSSAGCIHLYPDDIKALFNMVNLNTPVWIINQPYVAGWNEGKLYIEAHLPLAEQRKKLLANTSEIVTGLVNSLSKTDEAAYQIDWQKANEIVKEHIGVPTSVSYATTGF